MTTKNTHRSIFFGMDAERVREFLLGLPHVVETVQWGGRLVYWVGDKAIGGKIFAVVNLDGTGRVISYAAGRERFAELVENEGVDPAPYMARNFWVAVDGWEVFRASQWEQELTAAHQLIFGKLPPRTKAALAMPLKEQKKMIRERKALLAVKAAAKK
jgi:predicted DNA-binding protein (MmcQ/YjbR family)